MENNKNKLSKAPRDSNVRNGTSFNHDESGSPLNPTPEEQQMENQKEKATQRTRRRRRTHKME
jgi:hypothetical protein